MTQSRIFVHGLRAHADDMWSSALLIASKPEVEFTEIIRDANRISEAGENDFVLDCGMKFDGIRFFDHHQLEHTEKVDCTLTLIARTFAPWVLTDERFGALAERVRIQDNFGLAAAEKKFGKSTGWIEQEYIFVGLFEKEPLKIAGLLVECFRKRLQEVKESEAAFKWIENNSFIEVLDNGIKVLVFKTSPFKEGFAQTPFNSACSKYVSEKKVEVSYGWNCDGSDARTLFRTPYARAGIDFMKSNPAESVFCHHSGFLLIFNPYDTCEYRKLVFQAAG